MILSGLIFASILLSAVPNVGEFSGVQYTAPKNWQETTESQTRIFIPKDLKEDEILLLIMTGALPSNGSTWEKQFSDTVTLASDTGVVSDLSEVVKQEESGTTRFLQSLKLEQAPLGKHDRLYVQISQGKQRVFVTMLSNKDSVTERYSESVAAFLTSVSIKTVPVSKPPVSSTGPSTGRIPTGDTPDLFAGTVGWRPSGKGVSIPAPAITNGKPVGLWFKTQYDPNARNSRPIIHLYLANGIRASNPRLGGGRLFDLDGQRGQKGVTGLGSFTISGGQMVEKYGQFENKGVFSTGTGPDGKFFKCGAAKFYPLVPVTKETLAGHWGGPGLDYKFNTNGTYESGMTHSNGDWAIVGFQKGSYILDGYLIMLIPKDAPGVISVVGRSDSMMVTNGSLFFRK